MNHRQNKKKMGLFPKVLITILVLFLVFVAVFSITWRNEISSIGSIEMMMTNNEEHGDGYTYKIDIAGDYGINSFIEQGGVSNDQELIEFVSKHLTRNLFTIPIEEPDLGCSSYTAQLSNGNKVFGRNYDMDTTNIAIVHTDPGNGRYKSVSSVDLSFLGVSEEGISNFMDKIKILASPYVPLDGMNEKGLAIGIYMSYQGPGEQTGYPTNQLTDKPDITSTTFLRLMLDNAATVEEAIELAKSYDLHDSANSSYHYMVADASGDSAILEWIGEYDETDTEGSKRELKVIYPGENSFQVSTNFILAEGYYDLGGIKYGEDRFNLLTEYLSETNGVVEDEEAAMNLLARVGRRNWNNDDENTITTHSVVYNLSTKSIFFVGNEHFNDPNYEYRFQFD